jgi:MOSC domain-containing protein YiiM
MGTVLSVNVGVPRTVEHNGRRVSTAIWKQPVAGRVAVRGVNLDGDDQADRSVHGGVDKAVYSYAREDYEWWEGELDRVLGAGTFGENLTLSGVDISAAVIGERWQVGPTVLEVSEPRFPCFKLGIKMDDPRFLKRFAAARRPGAYLRIVEEGEVGAGDAVERLSRPEHGLTIAIFAEAYLGDRGLLPRLLEAQQVSERWREWAAEQLDRRAARHS